MTDKPLLLTDDDVLQLLTPSEAVATMENAILARAQGNAYGNPRWNLLYPSGRMTLTPGGVSGIIGHRTYLRGKLEYDDHLIAVWDTQTGRLKGMVVGAILGAMRTGGIGGVAVKHLARLESTSLALIGTGRQAFSQLQAILATRVALKEIRVYSRSARNRANFIADMRELYQHKRFVDCKTAEAAVRGADIVIGATSSAEPIIKGAWLKPGAHVSNVGPKGLHNREVDAEVVERAGFIVTDSLEQLEVIDPDGNMLQGTGKQAYDLSAVVSQQAGRPNDDAITLFISVGLAGTEVALANRLLEKYQRQALD